MKDQGENIVFLARELLNANLPENVAPKRAHVTLSFKALCLTTMLAAAGGGAVTGYVNANDRLINRYEKVEIDALIFYAARVKGVDEVSLRDDVASRIGINCLDNMTASEFQTARRYLQEKAQ